MYQEAVLTLTFNYTVASGHVSSDLSYVSSNPFILNNGTIVDVTNNSANMTLPDAGAQNSLSSNKAIIIDGTVSTIHQYLRMFRMGRIA